MLPSDKAEKDFSLLIHQVFGELGIDKTWVKRLSIVEWGRHPPKFDLRMWDSLSTAGIRAGKGITLSLEELQELKRILENMDLEHFVMPEKRLSNSLDSD